MEKINYKSKNTERKHLNNKRKNQFLRWKKQYFLRQSLKISREIKEIFLKPIIMLIGDMDKFEQK